MKTAFVKLLFLSVFVAGLGSCGKKSEEDVTPAAPSAGFQVKIDGKVYAPDFAYALANFPGANGYYAIYGLDSRTSDVVAIALPNSAVEGTYSLNQGANFALMSTSQENFSTINGGSGTVTIQKKTATTVAGTFSFTAVDNSGTKTRTFTEGTFNVTIR